jgi:hypothetical protein
MQIPTFVVCLFSVPDIGFPPPLQIGLLAALCTGVLDYGLLFDLMQNLCSPCTGYSSTQIAAN